MPEQRRNAPASTRLASADLVRLARGRLNRSGGATKETRSERPLTVAERSALLAALRAARLDRLLWVDRAIKNDRDRALDLAVFGPDGVALPLGSYVRMGATFRSGPTAALAELLEQWLIREPAAPLPPAPRNPPSL